MTMLVAVVEMDSVQLAPDDRTHRDGSWQGGVEVPRSQR